MARDVQSEESKALNQVEHNSDASAKRIVIRAQEPSSGNFVNIGATDNGDGSYSLKTASSSGSTQYTEGDTDATITGNALMMEDGSNTLRAATGNVANGLDVDVTRVSGTVTVDGSGVTQPVSNAGLTELAAAIGGTNPSQLDVYVKGSDVASGGTSAADDADFTAGTTSGTPAMGVYESSPTNVTDNDMGIVGITQGRRLKTSSTIDAALPAGTNNIGDVDVLSSALPTGAATSAKQDTGNSSLAAIQLAYLPEGTNTTLISPISTVIAGGVFDDGLSGAVALTDNAEFKTSDANTAAIKTAVETLDNAISGSEMQVDIVAALPAGNNNIGDVDIASIAAGDNNIGNVDVVTLPVAFNSGTVSATTQRVVLATDVALPAGTNAIGKLSANSGVDIGDVDVTSIAAGTNTIGNVGLVGRTSGGLTIFRSIDIDETEEEVKATAGQLFSITAFNRTAAPLYLKFYNATAANVTVGTTTPVLTFVVPANADSDGAGFIWNNDIGLAFGTAITVACTTGVADNDTGAPGANDCVINIGYM